MEKIKANLIGFIEKCYFCNHEGLEYWDKSDQELIYKCKFCKSYFSIPFNTNDVKFYFSL